MNTYGLLLALIIGLGLGMIATLGRTRLDGLLSLAPFQGRDHGVADLLPWATLMEDGLIINKDGSLLSGWFFTGLDVASLTPDERNRVTKRLNEALVKLGGDGWAVWLEAVRIPAASYPARASLHFPDAVTALIDEERRAAFEAEGAHFETEQAFLVMYTPPTRRKTWVLDWLYDDDADQPLPSDRQIEFFKRTLAGVEDAIGDELHLRKMAGFDYVDADYRPHHQDELVNFLHHCLTGSEAGLNIPPCAMHLDGLIGGQELWPGDTPRYGDQFLCCLAIEGFPAESFPFINDHLIDQPFAYRFSSRLILLGAETTKKELERFRRGWTQRIRGFAQQIFRTQGGYINEDAALMARQTELAISDVHSGLVAFGYYTAVIVLRSEDRQALTELARQLARSIGQLGFATRVETVNTLEAWLGTLPGHVHPNVRRPLISSVNFADLGPASARFTGLDRNPNPMFPENSPPLMYAATTGATPFRINLHAGDVGHTLIFGPTGAGKSVLLANIAAQFRRYPGATITVFDKGRSMFALAHAVGGGYYELAAETGSPGLCPLAHLTTDTDAAWAEEWLGIAFELQTNRPLTPAQRSEVHRAITLMRQAETSRSLSDFLTSVQDDEVRQALRAYSIDGPLGELLDARADGLGANRFTVFEIEELMVRREANLIPPLLYLFRRFEQSLTGQPALLILDEAWVMLGHPVFREKLREWLKTLRKANCAVVLATQSLSDAWRSGLIDVLMESCPTRFFLPNVEAHHEGSAGMMGPRDTYVAFGLNAAQIDIIGNAAPKRQYYCQTPYGCRLIDMTPGPIAHAFTARNSKADIAQVKALVRQHGPAWPSAYLQQLRIEYERYPHQLAA